MYKGQRWVSFGRLIYFQEVTVRQTLQNRTLYCKYSDKETFRSGISQNKPTFQLLHRKAFDCLTSVKFLDRSEVRYLTVAASAARTLDGALDNAHRGLFAIEYASIPLKFSQNTLKAHGLKPNTITHRNKWSLWSYTYRITCEILRNKILKLCTVDSVADTFLRKLYI